MADQNSNEEIIDLTELIEKGASEAKPSVSEEAEIDAHIHNLNDNLLGQEDSEIEALLAQMDSADGFSPEADSPNVNNGALDASEQLDMGELGEMDKLLESLDIPDIPGISASENHAPPKAAPKASQPVAAPFGDNSLGLPDDLDNVVDELLGGIAEAGSVHAPEPASGVSALDAPNADDLLASAMSGAAPAKARSAKAAAPEMDLDADLDSLLSDLDAETAKAPPASQAKKAPAGQAKPKAEANAPKPAPAKPGVAQAAPPEPAPITDVEMEAGAEIFQAAGVSDASENALDFGANLAAELGGTAAPASAIASSDALLADLDAALEATPGAESVSEMIPDDAPVPAAAEVQLTDPGFDAGALDALNVMGAAGSMTATAQLIPAQSASASSDHAVGESTGLLAALSERVESLFAEQKFLRDAFEDRLSICEQSISEALGRLEGLEKNLTSQAGLDDLLRDGSPLHQSFAALIGTSVSNALQNAGRAETAAADSGDSGIEQRLDKRLDEQRESLSARIQTLDILCKSLSARLDSLEARVDNLEPRFNQEIEKSAASAVARILREEISRLLEG